MSTFQELALIEPLLRAVHTAGYERPTPIQVKGIPPLLAGRDVIGCAQTGTGKTAAFALPILQHLHATPAGHSGRRPIRALVLSPTRELAAQIGDSFATYGRYLHVRHQVIFGGVNQNPQVTALRRGVDVLVATPGRLLDLVGQGFIQLNEVDFFVLDEADRMLDMGFIHDIRRVLALLPKNRQNLLFSATMPPEIADLAGSFLRDPIQVAVTPQSTPVERIEQTVLFVDKADKARLLAQFLVAPEVERSIVFTRTKHGANRLVKQLGMVGIEGAAIHGNKSQNARLRALDDFKSGDIKVLVATDLASRGLDVDGVTHVFNYDLPNEPESYVHRIGRTGRAGRDGIAISFCDHSEGDFLRDIERIMGESIPVNRDQPYHDESAVPPPPRSGRTQGKAPARTGGGGGGRSPRPRASAATTGPRGPAPAAERPAAPRAERPAAPRAERPAAPRAERPAAPRAERPAAPRNAERPAAERPAPAPPPTARARPAAAGVAAAAPARRRPPDPQHSPVFSRP
ncbi:MAG: DEAD/DEAH box helicase [bacterium]